MHYFYSIQFWFAVLSPIILLLSIMLLKEGSILWEQYKFRKNWSKFEVPTWENFVEVPYHKNIKLKWRVPQGALNKPLYRLMADNIFKSDKARKSLGHSISANSFGFGLSTNKRSYINAVDWTEMGPAEIVVTSVDVWIRGEGLEYRYKITSIEELSMTTSGDLILKVRERAWPVRIQLSKKQDYTDFVNMVYSLFAPAKKRQREKRQKSIDKYKMLDSLVPTDFMAD